MLPVDIDHQLIFVVAAQQEAVTAFCAGGELSLPGSFGSMAMGWSAGLKSVREGLFQSMPYPLLDSRNGTEMLVFA